MKQFIFISCIFFYVVYTLAKPAEPPTTNKRLLGSKECTWGPSYWCSNITNAKSCNAVTHCIKTVWEHKTVPEDDDEVCKICLQMVTQARDQLESNETQEELKEVFEGSCNLIPLKIIAHECDKLVDDFIPELVETLASQMNPQMVCSVAGLCNNARIDKLLEEEKSKTKQTTTTSVTAKPKTTSDDCDGCHTVVAKLQENFQTMSKDQVLHGFLNVCGRMSSLSDACTNIVLTYFNEIYTHLEENLTPDQVCLMAGVCTAQFHTHNDRRVNIEQVEITPLSDMGRVNVATKDDLPCKFCEQLIQHLRDLLVANTTENEFQRVLQGLCTQTKGFKDECLSIVNEYYPEIYHFLLDELNTNTVCVMLGICKPNVDYTDAAPTWALVRPEAAKKLIEITAQSKLIGQDEKNSYHQSSKDTVQIVQTGKEVQVNNPELVQLPIERMSPVSLTLNGNTQLCTFCEYFLHFLQQEITKPTTEEKLKKLIDGACDRLPKSVSGQCEEFVETYGDAFIALLAQEIDPSQVCPLLSLCPAARVQEVEILMHSKPEDKPNCPLCLFAVTQLESMIKNHKTEEQIREALSKLCSHLPKNLADECEDFVHTYAEELIEMLVADLSPQEVCVYLKLCDDKNITLHHPMLHRGGQDPPELVHRTQIEMDSDWTLTNEIPDNTAEGKIIAAKHIVKDRSPQCVICEFIMSQIERELTDKTNEDDVKRVVHGICNHLPKTVSKECNDFVDKYADAVIKLLIATMEPAEICSMLGLCSDNIVHVIEEVAECSICETVVSAMNKLFNNPKIDHALEHVFKKACLALPENRQEKCQAMIDTYGDSFISLTSKLSSPNAVCGKVGLCSNTVGRLVRDTSKLIGADRCTWGPSYWCTNSDTATECNATTHCKENYWKDKPSQ